MKLTILGTAAACPGAGEACSGFLIQEDKTNLLVDCGTGVLSKLQKCLPLTHVSDIVISHMHADHFFDLAPYRYAIHYGPAKAEFPKPRLYLPPGGRDILAQVTSPFSETAKAFEEDFNIAEYDASHPLEIGRLELRFHPVRHYIPSYGIAVSGSAKLAYTSDSGVCPQLLALARRADTLICNVGNCWNDESGNLWGHLRPGEAGALATDAGVRRLLITHLWWGCDRSLNLAEASRRFGGKIEIAEPFASYDLA